MHARFLEGESLVVDSQVEQLTQIVIERECNCGRERERHEGREGEREGERD